MAFPCRRSYPGMKRPKTENISNGTSQKSVLFQLAFGVISKQTKTPNLFILFYFFGRFGEPLGGGRFSQNFTVSENGREGGRHHGFRKLENNQTTVAWSSQRTTILREKICHNGIQRRLMKQWYACLNKKITLELFIEMILEFFWCTQFVLYNDVVFKRHATKRFLSHFVSSFYPCRRIEIFTSELCCPRVFIHAAGYSNNLIRLNRLLGNAFVTIKATETENAPQALGRKIFLSLWINHITWSIETSFATLTRLGRSNLRRKCKARSKPQVADWWTKNHNKIHLACVPSVFSRNPELFVTRLVHCSLEHFGTLHNWLAESKVIHTHATKKQTNDWMKTTSATQITKIWRSCFTVQRSIKISLMLFIPHRVRNNEAASAEVCFAHHKETFHHDNCVLCHIFLNTTQHNSILQEHGLTGGALLRPLFCSCPILLANFGHSHPANVPTMNHSKEVAQKVKISKLGKIFKTFCKIRKCLFWHHSYICQTTVKHQSTYFARLPFFRLSIPSEHFAHSPCETVLDALPLVTLGTSHCPTLKLESKKATFDFLTWCLFTSFQFFLECMRKPSGLHRHKSGKKEVMMGKGFANLQGRQCRCNFLLQAVDEPGVSSGRRLSILGNFRKPMEGPAWEEIRKNEQHVSQPANSQTVCAERAILTQREYWFSVLFKN